MQVVSMNSYNHNNNLNFGHSFRVSICLKNETGCGDIFVSPASNKALYKQLNSKIVGWLNEDYMSNLRKILGVEKKVNKTEPMSDIHKKMIEDLKKFDTDYSKLGCVRSVYNGGRLAYIATGVDVPIIENLKGAKQIGIAKADSSWYNGFSNSDYVKNLTKLVNANILDYVKNNNVVLRTKNNKEIMLRAVFKEVKNSKGQSVYELDRYEFHENKTNPTLPEINPEFLRYKYSSVQEEIKKTIKHFADKILGRKAHFNELEKIMQTTKEPT